MSEKIYNHNIKQTADAPSRIEGGLVSFSEGSTTAQFLTLPDTPSPAVQFKDVDNDGDLDIVIDNPSPTLPKWVENTLGKTANSIFNNNIFNRITPTAMAVGDINGDGNEDVVIGHVSGAKIFYNYDGWAMEDLGTVLSIPRTIVLDDINNDGEMDILIRDSKNLTLFQNHEGQLGAQNMSWPNLGDNPILGVGNFNLTTQAQEILVYQTHTSTIGIVAHNGNTWQCFQSVVPVHPTRLIISDFNHDGADDVYIEDTDGHTVVLESNGAGTLSLNNDQSNLNIDPTIVPNYDEPHTDNDSPCESSITPPSPMPVAPSPEPTANPSAPVPSLNSTMESQADSTDHTLDMGFHNTPTFTIPPVEEPNEVIGTMGGDILFGESCPEQLSGLAGSDLIFAGSGDDTLAGGQNSDYLWGEAGDDFIKGQQGSDMAFGGDGDDSIHGGCGNDVLFGDHGDDRIFGGKGDDLLSGDSGHDILKGGTGEDVMYGGAGNDTFLYTNAQEGSDLIVDFESGKDIFEFKFGSHLLYDTTDDLTDTTGNGFLWENTGSDSGKLYFDPDLAVEGNETLLAEVVFNDDEADITLDDISIV